MAFEWLFSMHLCPLPSPKLAVNKLMQQSRIEHSYRHDQVRDPLSGNLKYRRLYEKDGADLTFVLVGDPDSEVGARVVLFDQQPEV